MFAEVMSMHSRNMKQAHSIEFDETNLLAMLKRMLRKIFIVWGFLYFFICGEYFIVILHLV